MAQNIWEMEIAAPEIVQGYRGAGQFVNLIADSSWEHPLRRPMSIASVQQDVFTIIYKLMGPVTRRFSTLQSGDHIHVLGPLGNTFSPPESGTAPILVGGGVGLAPILNLYQEMNRQPLSPTLILGARTAAEHFIPHQPDRQVYLTTDDGTAGIPGNVIPTLRTLVSQRPNPMVYACGPEPMLKAVQSLSREMSFRAQLSVESYMGCGIGLCQGCVVRRSGQDITEHSYHRKYSLVCTDGPVYFADEVQFD